MAPGEFRAATVAEFVAAAREGVAWRDCPYVAIDLPERGRLIDGAAISLVGPADLGAPGQPLDAVDARRSGGMARAIAETFASLVAIGDAVWSPCPEPVIAMHYLEQATSEARALGYNAMIVGNVGWTLTWELGDLVGQEPQETLRVIALGRREKFHGLADPAPAGCDGLMRALVRVHGNELDYRHPLVAGPEGESLAPHAEAVRFACRLLLRDFGRLRASEGKSSIRARGEEAATRAMEEALEVVARRAEDGSQDGFFYDCVILVAATAALGSDVDDEASRVATRMARAVRNWLMEGADSVPDEDVADLSAAFAP